MGLCEKCSAAPAVWNCHDGCADLCEKCWGEIHSYGKLKKHVKTVLDLPTRTVEWPLDCAGCENLSAVFWCDNCEAAFCNHCKVSTHKEEGHHNHAWFLLQVVNEAGDVALTFDDADKIYQLEQTELVHINEQYQVALTTKTYERCLTRSKHSVFSPVVCFTGATHAGKSTMINTFMRYHNLDKRAMIASPKEHAATTSDIHLYQVPNPWTVGNVRLLDMEGFSASDTLPKGIRWDRVVDPTDQHTVAKHRNAVVNKLFPSLAYFVADVLVYVLQGDLAVAEYANKAKEFAESSATTLVTDAGRKPALIIVRNKTGKNDAIFDVDECTSKFMETHDQHKKLLDHFFSVHVISIPYDDFAAEHTQQIQQLDRLLKDVTERQYRQLIHSNQLLSEYSWCKLLQHAVTALASPEAYQAGLKRGDIDSKLVTFNNPIAHQTWRLMGLLNYIPERGTYENFEKKLWHVFTSLVLAEEDKQQHGEKRSLAADPLVAQASSKLKEALKMLAPCWAKHAATTNDQQPIYCVKSHRTHIDNNYHASRRVVTKVMDSDSRWVKVIKYFQFIGIKIPMIVYWIGQWEAPVTFDHNHFDGVYSKMRQQQTSDDIAPMGFSVLHSQPAKNVRSKVQIPEDLNCLFCLLKPRTVSANCGCKIVCQPCALRCLEKKQAKNFFHRSSNISLLQCPICRKGKLVTDRKTVVEKMSLRLGKNIGSYANVFVAHNPASPAELAVKVTMLHNYESQKAFWREANLMMSVTHNNIMKPLGYWQDPAQGDRLGLVMPYLPEGDVRQMIRSGEFGKDWQTNMHKLAKHVAKALVLLHKMSIVHCDVKLSNILVGRGNKGKPVFKLTDFGIARKLKEPHKDIKKIRGTIQYMAPELFHFRVSTAVDMYAYGVLVYEASHGQELWPGAEPGQVMEKAMNNLRPHISPEVPSNYAELIVKCWDDEPSHRCTAIKALEYLKGTKQVLAMSPYAAVHLAPDADVCTLLTIDHKALSSSTL